MEIEKKRETSWKIQLDKTDEYIEVTSIEVSGEVRNIKLTLINKDKSIKVKINKDKFFKFLSLLSAFKDVVIGDDSIILDNRLEIIENKKNNSHEYKPVNEKIYPLEHESSKNTINNKETEELNPEEWDPW